MTREEWLSSNAAWNMVWHLGKDSSPLPSTGRQLELITCAWRRLVEHPLEDEDREEIEAAERAADQPVVHPDQIQLLYPTNRMRDLWDRGGFDRSVWPATFAAAVRDIVPDPWVFYNYTHGGVWRNPSTLGQELLLKPGWCSWHDGLLPAMTQELFAQNRFEDLPVLADALEDYGCSDSTLLEHCRGPVCPDCLGSGFVPSRGVPCPTCQKTGRQPLRHFHGCWVLDLLRKCQ